MQPSVVDGDLLDQPVEVIVNAWNRNVIPFASIAFPVIGAGSGGHGVEGALALMLEAFAAIDSHAQARIVRFRPASGTG